MPEITNEEKSKNISIYYSSYSESWYFDGEAEDLFEICSCGIIIDHRHVHIINKLKKAKLLDEDYPILCCRCFEGEIKNAS